MTKIFFLLLFSITIIAQDYQLKNAEGFPKWLSKDNYLTDQTSGIAFINSENHIKKFLLADDIGKLHLLFITNDSLLSFEPINFSKEVEQYLSKFPKKDFEEITLDNSTNLFYLSIEGNDPNHKNWVGIYKINFNPELGFSEINGLEKIEFTPNELFLKDVKNNIGYEGLAVDSNYFYLGLEGFQNDTAFEAETIILIADKKSNEIIKKINTKELGIHTICGLVSDKPYSLWGIDRNSRKVFHLNFDSKLNVTSSKLINFVSAIPGYKEKSYVSAIESITIDNENNIYLVDDPWKRFYVPPEKTLNKLDEITINNFKNFIPIIYKLNLKID